MRYLRLPAMFTAALAAFVLVVVMGTTIWSWVTLLDDPPPGGPACTYDFGSGSTGVGRERIAWGLWSWRECDDHRPDGSRFTMDPVGGMAARWTSEVALGSVVVGLPTSVAAVMVVDRLWPASSQVSGVDTPA